MVIFMLSGFDPKITHPIRPFVPGVFNEIAMMKMKATFTPCKSYSPPARQPANSLNGVNFQRTVQLFNRCDWNINCGSLLQIFIRYTRYNRCCGVNI